MSEKGLAEAMGRERMFRMNSRQARLSLVMGVVAALGTAAILWAWWDSMENYMVWVSREWMIVTALSNIEIRVDDHLAYHDILSLGFNRNRLFEVNTAPTYDLYFPAFRIYQWNVVLPMWFLLCASINVLLLLWLVIMKRLARPRITEG